METATKQNPVRTLWNGVKRHERKILATITVASTATALVMGTSVHKHNAFLKENGLFEQFYDLTPTVEA